MRRLALCLSLAALPATAFADVVDLKFGGMISSDIRYRFNGERVVSPYPSQYQLLPHGFSRNENIIKAKISATVGAKIKAVADVDLVLYGFSDVRDIDAATLRERVDPYRFEAHAAYVDIYQLLPGVDLRIGRQVVQWGAADQFNPTSNVNTLDFSDALVFGRALGNNMVRVDWNPKSDWILTGVWVPIFRPSELPRTAPIAITQLDRPAPVQDDFVRERLYFLAGLLPPTSVGTVALQPEVTLANSQVGLRLGGRLLDQDVSLSYYHGRFGIPGPVATIQHEDGHADVALAWPKMDVIGADVAGSINKLKGLGYWFEGALIVPQQMDYALYRDVGGVRSEVRVNGAGNPTFFPVGTPTQLCPAGKTGCGAYPGEVPPGNRPIVIPSTPFLKLTVGADLSIGPQLYANVQYVHGFIDEFGSGKAFHTRRDPTDMFETPRTEQRLGDYLIAGLDLKLFNDVLLCRLFGVLKLPSVDVSTGQWEATNGVYKWTGVLFPQVIWSVWDGTELMVGAFLFLGDRDTKFGDPAAGASEVFARVRFTY